MGYAVWRLRGQGPLIQAAANSRQCDNQASDGGLLPAPGLYLK